MRNLLNQLSRKEKALFKKIKARTLSLSHNLDHLQNTLYFALKLGKIYQANREILIPACLLHDLGRSKRKLHGKDSIKESCRQAKLLLEKTGYSAKEIRLICQVIVEHDQPKLKPKTLEAKILKEADFLDGFGARGILRAVYWSGESGKPFDKTLGQLQKKMTQRYKSLELPESKAMASQQFFFSQTFLSSLQKTAREPRPFKGRYLVFEGISGTGKETQARLLKKFFKEKGYKTVIIYHPTLRLKKTLREWHQEKLDSLTEALMFIADRKDTVRRFLLPALLEGKIVISLRNKISTLVYQAKTDLEINLFEYLYSFFEPEPELIFYFDLDFKKAMARVLRRTKETGEIQDKFENLKDLKANQQRYQKIIKRYPKVVILDAAKNKVLIHKQIIDKLKREGFYGKKR